jgi:hypothetical protein
MHSAERDGEEQRMQPNGSRILSNTVGMIQKASEISKHGTSCLNLEFKLGDLIMSTVLRVMRTCGPDEGRRQLERCQGPPAKQIITRIASPWDTRGLLAKPAVSSLSTYNQDLLT